MENSNERWVTVKDCSDYQISDWGRVKSKKTGKFISPQVASGKYLIVRLRTDLIPRENKPTQSYAPTKLYPSLLLHRLVAQHFVDNPNPEFYTCVTHIDGDKNNNAADNLKWVADDKVPHLRNTTDKGKFITVMVRKYKKFLNQIIPDEWVAEGEDFTPYEFMGQFTKFCTDFQRKPRITKIEIR